MTLYIRGLLNCHSKRPATVNVEEWEGGSICWGLSDRSGWAPYPLLSAMSYFCWVALQQARRLFGLMPASANEAREDTEVRVSSLPRRPPTRRKYPSCWPRLCRACHFGPMHCCGFAGEAPTLLPKARWGNGSAQGRKGRALCDLEYPPREEL